MEKRRLEVFLEFLIFGVAMGVVEDMIAIVLSTGQTISPQIILVVTLVAIPFAAIGELVVDRINILPPKDGKKTRKG